MRKFFTFFFLLFNVFAIGALAADAVEMSGTCGTCEWSVSHETLTIRPLDGASEGELADWGATAPWHDAASSITVVRLYDTVKPVTLKGMFAGMSNLQFLVINGIDFSKVGDSKADITVEKIFADTPCPQMLLLPASLTVTPGVQLPLPDLADADARLQDVANGTMFSPAGNVYSSSKEMVAALAAESVQHFIVQTKTLVERSYTINSTTGMGTLCYPVAINLLDDDRNYKARPYRVTSVEKDANGVVLVLEAYGKTTLEANTPVLLFRDGGTTITLPKSSGRVSMAPVTVSEEGNLLVGCNGRFPIFGDPDSYDETLSRQYVYQKKNGKVAFYRVRPSVPVHTTPYRCFLELPAADVQSKLNVPRIDFSTPSDGPTAIDRILSDGVHDGAARSGVYDLQGRRVDEMRPGNMYIVNGVKVFVKR